MKKYINKHAKPIKKQTTTNKRKNYKIGEQNKTIRTTKNKQTQQ